jgi:gliding motility-associated-like protein
VRVYRDCINGDAAAPFDDPAAVGVFDFNTGTLLQDLRVPFVRDSFISNDLGACLVATEPVCVHTTIYRTIATLPFRPGGYRLVYQRCCRNRTIKNIVRPLETGATYDIVLTEEAMRRCNNSAQFRAWPDVYVCSKTPLVFDHSATDADGDSLVYKLCTPFQGATFANPQPQPPGFPPYDTLVWAAGYSTQNMLGFGIPLRIDARTGLLTATPDQVGQYVVGICVEEYDRRTRRLVASTRRDFQYNVQLCESVTAAFFSPESQCDSLQVRFRNESRNADDFRWFFDFPRTNLTSTERDPVFSFPRPGTYQVALIAEPGTSCADTAYRTIRLFPSSLRGNMLVDVLPCAQNAIVQTVDLSSDESSTIVRRSWVISFDNQRLTNSRINPIFVVPLNISGTIQLTVTNANGCTRVISQAFNTNVPASDPTRGIPDTIRACVGTVVNVNPSGNPNTTLNYRWEPAAAFDNPTSPTPRFSVGQTGPVTLTVTADTAIICSVTKRITVIGLERPRAVFSVATSNGTVGSCDSRNLALVNTSSNAGTYSWRVSRNTLVLTSTASAPSFTLTDTGTYEIRLIASNGICSDTSTQRIRLNSLPINLQLTDDLSTCGEPARLTASGTGSLTYRWTNRVGQVLGTTASISVSPAASETYFLAATNAAGCTERDSVRVTNNDAAVTLQTPNSSSINQCTATNINVVTVNGRPNDQLTFTWSPAANIVSGGATGNPTIRPNADGRTVITGIARNQFNCEDTITLTINVGTPNPNFPPIVTACPGVATPIGGPAVAGLTYAWAPATGLSATNVSNPNFIGTASTRYFVTVTDNQSGQNCQYVDTVQVNIAQRPNIQVSPADTSICQGTSATLRATGATDFTWFRGTTQVGTGPSVTLSPGVGENLYTLVGRSEAGCLDTVRNIRIRVNAFEPGLPSPQTICANTPTAINPNGNAAYRYTWAPTTGLNLTNPHNPLATLSQNTTYRVTATDPATGCSISKDVQINVRSAPEFTRPRDTTVCNGNAVPLRTQAATGTTVTWQNSTGGSIGTGSSVSVTPAIGSNTYFLVVADGNCSVRDTITITRANFQPGDLATPQNVCAGVPTALNPNGNAAYTYVWSPTTGLSLATPHNPVATVNVSTTYNVTVTDPVSGCILTKAIQINVPDLSSFRAPNDTTVCNGNSLSLRARANEGISVTWLNAAGMTVGTGNTLNFTPVIGNNLLVAVGTVGTCTVRDTLRINRANFQPGDLTSPQNVCPAVPTPLNPNGNAAYTYVWSPTTGLNLATPHNPIATVNAPTTYNVTVTDPVSGCTLSKPIQVNVPDLSTFRAPNDTTVCDGNTLNLRARANEGVTVTWLNAAGTTIGTGTTLTFTPAIGNNLLVAVASVGTCTLRDTLRINRANFQPGDLKSPQEVCAGVATPLNPNGNPAYRYTWSPTTGLDLANLHNPVVTVSQNTTYSVTVVDPATGCTLNKTLQVNVTPPLTVIALPDTSLCAPGRLTLSATTSPRPAQVTWYRDRNLTQVLGTGNRISVQVGTGRNVFYAAVTDTNDVCVKAQRRIAGGGTGSGGTGTGGTGGTGGPGSGGTGNPLAGVPLDSAVVVVSDLATGAPPAEILACRNTPTPLNPNGNPNFRYNWAPAASLSNPTAPSPAASITQTTTYFVTITDQSGNCQLLDTVTVRLSPPINTDAGRDTTLCSTDPFTLRARGTGVTIYEWSTNRRFEPITSRTDSLRITPSTTSTTYYVRTTNAAGCQEIDSVRVVARPVNATLPPTSLVCKPRDPLTLRVTNNDPSQTLTYLWSPANVLLTPANQGPEARVTAINGTEVAVLLTNQLGCTATLRSRVTVVDLLGNVRINVEKPTIKIGESTRISVENCVGCSVTWTPTTDLTPSTGTQITASPTDTITYTATVTKDGCTETFRVRINVAGPYCIEPFIFVPTAFTPNGDNVNDVLFVRGRGITQMTFIIYNRWGQQVFSTTNQNVGWDGTFRGRQLPPDVYGYYLTALCVDGTSYRKQGNVTLIR